MIRAVTGLHRDPPPRRGSRDRIVSRALWVLSVLVVGVAAVAFAVAPHAGALLWHVVAGVIAAVVMVTPLARGARPVSIWLVQAGACLLLLVTVGARFVETIRGTELAVTDLTYLAGFWIQVVWLWMLVQHVSVGGHRNASYDSFITGVGACLGMWVMLLAPFAGGDGLPSALLWALYPVIDIALITLALHLGVCLGRLPVALRLYLLSIGTQLVLDLTYSFTMAMQWPVPMSLLLAAYIVPYLGWAAAAAHPTIVELSDRPSNTRHARMVDRAALMVFSISPAVLAAVVPPVGAFDAFVRAALVAAMLGLVFVRLSGTLADLTRAEEQSHERATHDALTGLLNRGALSEDLQERLRADAVRGRYTAVVFVDCDHFKHVNDTWGHDAGDALLRAVGTRLTAVLTTEVAADDRTGRRSGSSRPPIVGRHGGDEFVVVATVDSPEEADRVAQAVLHVFDGPLSVRPGRTHPLTPSVGLAVAAPHELCGVTELIGRADAAMYEAKQSGGNRCVVFDEDLAAQSRRRAEVADRLGAAVAGGRFTVALQPVRGRTLDGYGTLLGWEALARWDDPELGVIPPDVFIPLAEEWGLIGELGEQILDLACRDLARLRAAMPGQDLSVFVNISPAQLLRPEFAATVRRTLEDTGIPPQALGLEITESLLVDQSPVVLDTLQDLRGRGIRLYLDDFGTGYASLATLLRLPLDCVKLDRSMIAALDREPGAGRRIAAVLELVASLGIDAVVAEGVETAAQARILHRLGCPRVQGWHFGRPVPAEVFLSDATTPSPLTSS